MKVALVVFSLLLLFSCARAPVRDATEALRITDPPQFISDDLPMDSLVSGIEATVLHLEKSPDTQQIRFGERVLTKEEHLFGLRRLAEIFKEGLDPEALRSRLIEEFDFYEVYGKDSWGEVLVTSYFEPVIEGSKTKTSRFTQPLYLMPDDMVEIDLATFQALNPDIVPKSLLRGRIDKERSERGNFRVVPYYSREEIDVKGMLLRRGLVACWVDPIEAFFLQIQGSGTIQVSNKNSNKNSKKESIRVGYGEQNGHPYFAIGKLLTDAIPIEKMSLQSIEAHLRSLPREEAQTILNKNPSYIFFKKREGDPITFLGTPVVAGRTIATDPRFLPKGAVAFLEFEKPLFDSQDAIEPKEWLKVSRFVLDQDKGGAIKDADRVDLFWGTGPEARQSAGVIRHPGRLVYVVPKTQYSSTTNNEL